MKTTFGNRIGSAAALAALMFGRGSVADPPAFHHAPAEAAQLVNPYANLPDAIQAGSELYLQHCAVCHGRNAEGSGNIPALAHGAVQAAAGGQVFWFITKGSISGAMPSWASLPEEQRWQIVSYLQTLGTAPISPRKVSQTDPIRR
jgi:mono/diheme cytochrome c family protein